MELAQLLGRVDHTLLAQTATWPEIRQLCDDALRFCCASVCIPPSYVRQAADYLAGRLPVCTVIGFPNGYSTTAVKCFEAADAVANGAVEIDMVINLGWVKDGNWEALLAELRAVRATCPDAVLKVIIETCLLTETEKIHLCEVVSQSGADYIKTSTGFAGGGATPGGRGPAEGPHRPPPQDQGRRAASPPSRTERTSWRWARTGWAPAASSRPLRSLASEFAALLFRKRLFSIGKDVFCA